MYRPYHFNQESIAGTVFIALLRGGHTLWLVMYDLIKSAGEHSVVASVQYVLWKRDILNVILPVCCIAVI